MTTPSLKVELVVAPHPITRANRKEVTVGMTVTNLGSEVIDPQIGMSVMTVDGQRMKAWSMAINNSGHPGKARALPPGDHVTSRYRLADELFPKAGEYKLELVVSGVAAEPLTVRVTD